MAVPSIAVVIPTYNEEQFIGRCLRAVADVNYPVERLSVVVMDNFSDDNTKAIASTFAVKIVDVPRSTIAATRNTIGLHTRSDLIAFLDADCVVSREWLDVAAKHFDDSSVVAVGCYPSVIVGESSEFQVLMSRLYRRASRRPVSVDWLPSSNMIVRSSAFQKIGGFNERLETCEDSDLGYRLRRLGTLLYDNGVEVYHLREPRDLGELFSKELWRARGNLYGFVSHGMSFSEVPSVLFPIIFGAGACFGLFGLWAGGESILFGMALSALPIMVYCVRGYIKVGSIKGLPMVYLCYLSARALSAGIEMCIGIKYVITACGAALGRKPTVMRVTK